MTPPFSYERRACPGPYKFEFRVADAADDRVAACYDEANAIALVQRLNESAALTAERDELRTALAALVAAARDAHDHWDADRDAKVGKLLAAMAGHLRGYRAALDAVWAVIDAGGLRRDPG